MSAILDSEPSAAGIVPLVDDTSDISPTGAFHLTLEGMTLPLLGHLFFNALGLMSALLLGHAWFGVAGFVLSTLVDAGFQRQIARWRSAGIPSDSNFMFPRLAAYCALRAIVLLSAPTAMALGGDVAPLIYFAAVFCSITTLGIANGSLSAWIFAAYVAPPIIAACALVFFVLHGAAAVGAGLGFLTLGLLLFLVCIGTRKAVGAWHSAFTASRELAADLSRAHKIAVAEKTAAEEAREEARHANRAKSNFLATMSHEIRTPMNGVLGMAHLLKRDEIDPIQRARIDTLMQSGEYLLAILNDILDVSKIDAGKFELSPKPESLHQFLNGIVDFWSPRADEKGLSLRLDMADSVPDHVWMDAVRCRQILFNLVGNALKFTEKGGVICRADARQLSESSALLHLTICDTGPGVRPEDLDTLFEQFSQGEDSSTRRFGGTGLGLSIARQLIELMAGRIWVESVFGEGAEFHIEIPLDYSQAAGDGEAEDAVLANASACELDVLIVDDNAINLLVLNQMLGAFGHRITQASDGPEALTQLALQPFDMVLMDIQMPGMTGVEVLQRLRAKAGPNRTAPVVALTADVTSGGREKYLSLGFDDHSTKPIQIEDVVRAMASAMAKGSEVLSELQEPLEA